MQADCRHSLTCIAAFTLTLVILTSASGCRHGRTASSFAADTSHSSPLSSLPSIVIADTAAGASPVGDTLTAVTLNGPTSYFIYKDKPMGYDYTLLHEFAVDSRIAVRLFIAPDLSAAVNAVRSGEARLLAYNVPVTAHYRRWLRPCGAELYSSQVLVQPKVKGRPAITDVTGLIGREVYVLDDSKYQRRLEHLNEELADEIIIRTLPSDSVSVEDLVAMVSAGEIPFAVVDSNIGRLNKTYYPDIDISLEISTPQRASWAVAADDTALADTIDLWFANDRQTRLNVDLLKRFFEMSKVTPDTAFDFSSGRISLYDDIFRRYAPDIHWDWRLLAAQAYVESLFNPAAGSWAGASGLMQVMPSTARAYGVQPAALLDPEQNVRVAVRVIADLDRYLLDRVPNDRERIKFILAAYNCGIGHIYDAIDLARREGLDPQVWDDNVEKALLLKMNPRRLNDSDIRFGYTRGSETTAYVRRVSKFYQRAILEIPL